MEIINRIENKLLHRVELEFRWKHTGKKTPSRMEVLAQVQSLEPGSDRNLVVIKDCNTRFGMAMTTGRAYVYDSAEAMQVEPEYIMKRHEALHGGASQETPSEEAADEPAEETEEGGEA